MHARVKTPMRSAGIAVVCLCSLLVGSANAAPNSVGTCYASGHVPPLPSRARVFITATLQLESTSASGRSNVVEVARPTIVVARTSVPGNDMTLVPSEKPVTVRATPSICVYPPDARLPSALAGVEPDIVAP